MSDKSNYNPSQWKVYVAATILLLYFSSVLWLGRVCEWLDKKYPPRSTQYVVVANGQTYVCDHEPHTAWGRLHCSTVDGDYLTLNYWESVTKRVRPR